VASLILVVMIVGLVGVVIARLNSVEIELNRKYEVLREIRDVEFDSFVGRLNDVGWLRSRFVNDSRFARSRDDLDEYNIEVWGYPVVVDGVEIYYPIKEFLDVLSGLSVDDVEKCICEDSSKCNELVGMDYVWGGDVCEGLPVRYRVYVKKRGDMSWDVPYYLFGGECVIRC